MRASHGRLHFVIFELQNVFPGIVDDIMSVRVVARIRPLLNSEIEKDVIVHATKTPGEKEDSKTAVKIPNPRNLAESFSFRFNSVYEQNTTQSELFDNEGRSENSPR